ncbi:hypothetical protein SHKM778_95120 (plasmid) [Streptomyces sp. KM77-8]|uniref:Uncharacterized protein n=1 Tax=Streptomyces haneummycinicus TaxID=3074435 RepID=A0AAT9I021_9ACTN
MEKAITDSVGGAASTLTQTLLPSAMVIGALVAWANHRRAAGSSLSQLGWVAVSTIFSISLLMAPQTWVNGIDSARNVGSSIAMNATSAGLGDGTKEPIDLGHGTTYGDNERDNMLRKSSDAVWRTYVVTPWCVVQFGSLEVCKEKGKEFWTRASTRRSARSGWPTTSVVTTSAATRIAGSTGTTRSAA